MPESWGRGRKKKVKDGGKKGNSWAQMPKKKKRSKSLSSGPRKKSGESPLHHLSQGRDIGERKGGISKKGESKGGERENDFQLEKENHRYHEGM